MHAVCGKAVTAGVQYGQWLIGKVMLCCVLLSHHLSSMHRHQQAVPNPSSMRAEAQARRKASSFRRGSD